MNYSFKFLFGIFLIILSTGLDAQITPGYTIGFNMARMKLVISGKNPEQETMTGVRFGKIYGVPLNAGLSLQSGFLFSSKGSFYKIDSLDIGMSPIYIEIPVRVSFEAGTESIKLNLFAGPYLAYSFAGRFESGNDVRNLKFGTGTGKDLRPFDFGMNLGAGLVIGDIMIFSSYGFGLVNLIPVRRTGWEMKNRVFDISIMGFFDKKQIIGGSSN